jgi:hypothetical protein
MKIRGRYGSGEIMSEPNVFVPGSDNFENDFSSPKCHFTHCMVPIHLSHTYYSNTYSTLESGTQKATDHSYYFCHVVSVHHVKKKNSRPTTQPPAHNPNYWGSQCLTLTSGQPM